MKVYVVTVGEYSDYHIQGVFTSRKKADKFVGIFNRCHDYDEARTEEYDTAVKVIGFTFSVSKYLETGELYAYTLSGEYDDAVTLSDGLVRGEYIGPVKLVTHVVTDSLEKAKKIALDRFTAYEAREAGI